MQAVSSSLLAALKSSLGAVLPLMTGATTSGVTMSADSSFGGFDAWQAASGGNTSVDMWISGAGALPHWIKVDFGSAKTIAAYFFQSTDQYPDNMPLSWTLQGSNNDSTYTTIDTHSGAAHWTAKEKRFFTVTTPGSYRYYKVNITAIQTATRVALMLGMAAAVSGGWAVTGVSETTLTQPGDVTGGSADSTTSVTTSIKLAASTLGVTMTYVSTLIDNEFQGATINYNGAALDSTDASLDSAIRLLAPSYIASQDAVLLSTINSGPATDPLAIPSDMLTALTASLADSTVGWVATARVENILTNADLSVIKQVVVCLGIPLTDADGNDVPYLRLNAGSSAPASMSYIATFDANGNFLGAQVIFNGVVWRSTDSALNTTIMALGNAYKAAQVTAISGGLTAGPQ